jgi:hypothetical protein
LKRLASLFIQDVSSAIFILEYDETIKNKVERSITPIEYWASKPNDQNIISAAKRLCSKVDLIVANPIEFALNDKKIPVIVKILEAVGLGGTDVVDAFSAATGLAAFFALKDLGRLRTENFQAWPKIEADIMQTKQKLSAIAFAFCQGLIDISFTDYSGSSFRELDLSGLKNIEGQEAIDWMLGN